MAQTSVIITDMNVSPCRRHPFDVVYMGTVGGVMAVLGQAVQLREREASLPPLS